jgi:hypothetical protein
MSRYDALDVDNYRPISLLSSVSKILEKIVAGKLTHHLLSNDLLYQHQYGFLPTRSTEQNLIQVVDYISNALNDNMYCIGIFLDLRKAFDVCSHEILLKKLKKWASLELHTNGLRAILRADLNVSTLVEIYLTLFNFQYLSSKGVPLVLSYFYATLMIYGPPLHFFQFYLRTTLLILLKATISRIYPLM